MKNIQEPNLLTLNLLSNKNIDYSNFITDESHLNSKLFYISSDLSISEKKLLMVEKLISNNLLESNYLANFYNKYILIKNISLLKDYSNVESSLEKRAAIYNQIRNTSSQEKLLLLMNSFVSEMRSKKLLMNTADLIYDKIKVVVPKEEFKEYTHSVCIILIINNDTDRCKEWLDVIKNDNDAKNLLSKLYLYISLNEPDSEKSFYNQREASELLFDDELSSNNKNLLAKFFMIRQSNNMSSYWSSKDRLSIEKTTTMNINLIEYLRQIPENKIGEAILLISLIYVSYSNDFPDSHSLFVIIEALEKIKKDYTNQFIFEYFVNNSL